MWHSHTMTANGERMRQIWVRKGSGEGRFIESVQGENTASLTEKKMGKEGEKLTRRKNTNR